MTTPSVTNAIQSFGRQRWAWLVPILFVTYSLAFLDRSNFSIALAGGMAADVGIDQTTSGLLGGAFFLGYCTLQIPALLFVSKRHSLTNMLFICVLGWGVLASLQAVANTGVELLIIRFLLGALEAPVLPALVVLAARWFTKPERGRVNALFLVGNPATLLWMSALSGYLIEISNWRIMFLVEGLPALAWAIYFRIKVRDTPSQAKWLKPHEATAVEAEIIREQTELHETTGAPNPRVFLATLSDWRVWVLTLQYGLWTVGVVGIGFWLPSIVKAGSETGIGATGLLTSIPYLIAVPVMFLSSRWSDRTGRRRGFIWPWLLVAGIFFYSSYAAGPQNFWLAFVCLIIASVSLFAPYGPFFARVSEVMPQSIAAIATAFINTAAGLGGFAGIYLIGWLGQLTGTSSAAFIMLSLVMLVAAALTFAVPNVRRGIRARAQAPNTAAAKVVT